jgi:tetratricopeptide (TPR) repeat protein
MGRSPSAGGARRFGRWLLPLLLVVASSALDAQGTLTMPAKALQLEQEGKWREAVTAYRAAMREASLLPVVLGLERVYSQLGWSDSLLPLLDSLLVRHPLDSQLRTVQLRTLTWMDRDTDARQAFAAWRAAAPRDPAPFREYARLLLGDGRATAADTVLREGQRTLGNARDFPVEMAQLRSALGLWAASAASWREAVEQVQFMEPSAAFSLLPAPDSVRDAIRDTLAAPPVSIPARRVLASLELRWRSARDAWRALSDLPAGDAAQVAWLAFADEAEQQQQWLVARDALQAVLKLKPDRDLAARAASDAMSGGDPASVLALLAPFDSDSDSATVERLLPFRVRALAELGRPVEAARALDARGGALAPTVQAQLTRSLAWGWVRAGDLQRAAAALAESPMADDDRITGWIALSQGDLEGARRGLRRSLETSPDIVLAQALLARTSALTAPSIGRAFLALAQRDSLGAARAFRTAADSVRDAAAPLLGTSARLFAAVGDTDTAIAVWSRMVDQHQTAPETIEAELEWSRTLLARGDRASAVEHLEHLILTWPASALVPQARQALDRARERIPSSP